MENKIVLITGATAGIGKETALGIAKTGANVVIVGRSKQKCESVVEEIKCATNNANVDFLTADLFSLTEIRKLADDFKAKYQRLDVLVNNAGAIFTKREITVDGFEKTLALNHLSYFLLTNLLLDTIKQTENSRIVSVSSTAHTFANKIDFNNLNGEKSHSGLGAYGVSKLMNIMFTYEIARRLKGSNVAANCLHPGVVASNFGETMGSLYQIPIWIFKNVFAISAAKGAETSVYLATSPEVEGVTGRYFDNKRETQSSKISYDESLQRQLWETSEKLVGQQFQPTQKI
ncbi:MAG: SDR family oxidoreductase [Pyrinomonadaceae bacterium]|nr:SDR family oxidoreductase [Pyrinomonadaceae bacterium]